MNPGPRWAAHPTLQARARTVSSRRRKTGPGANGRTGPPSPAHGPRVCFQATVNGRAGTTGRPVRRHSAETAEEGGPAPTAFPTGPRRKELTTGSGPAVRVVRHTDRRGGPPGPQARRPRRTDGHSPAGRSSWPGCAGRPSWSAPPATRPSSRAPDRGSRRSRWRATCWKPARGVRRGSLEGPASAGPRRGLPVLSRVGPSGRRGASRLTDRNWAGRGDCRTGRTARAVVTNGRSSAVRSGQAAVDQVGAVLDLLSLRLMRRYRPSSSAGRSWPRTA